MATPGHSNDVLHVKLPTVALVVVTLVAETVDAVTAPVEALIVSCGPAKRFKELYVFRSSKRETPH